MGAYGAALRAARGKRSQLEVAEHLGIDQGDLSRIEVGKRAPLSRDLTIKVAELTRVDPAHLLSVRAAEVGGYDLPTTTSPLRDELAAELSARWDRLSPRVLAVLRWALRSLA